MLLKDFEKSEEINHFSQESKDLITSMGNNEIFEFYETSSKRQCPDCAFYWEIGIVFCSLRKRCDNSTETDLTHCRSLDAVLGMVNHCVKQCITKHVIC